MKRISWKLDRYNLPDYDFYDKTNKKITGQVPIPIENRNQTADRPELPNRSFFLGVESPYGDNGRVILCFHIEEGKYIPISQDQTFEKFFQAMISLYSNKGLKLQVGNRKNPDSIPTISTSGEVLE